MMLCVPSDAGRQSVPIELWSGYTYSDVSIYFQIISIIYSEIIQKLRGSSIEFFNGCFI
jgi:hypothetical protein